MGMPKKGSRDILVNDVYYRYAVKEVKAIASDAKETVLIAQQVAEKPGNVMRVRYQFSLEIGPAFVIKEIGRALKAGWDPSKRGAAFDLPEETQNGK